MRPSFWHYLREAFNARPIGMFVPPNWIGLAAAGLLAAVQPTAEATAGVLAVGAGAEMAYLLALATHQRFQRFVAGKLSLDTSGEVQRRADALIASLPDADKRRYAALRQRCLGVLDQQFHGDLGAPGYSAQSDSLGKLTWMYLRLLATRQGMLRVLRESPRQGEPPPIPGAPSQRLEERLADLRRRLADPALPDDLRHSLTSQMQLVEQRLERRGEADRKLAFVEAEITRIEEQVELIREQAVLSTDPDHLSRRIDEIGATLGSTGQWIAEQQQALGAMDDLMAEPPPLTSQATRPRTRQSQ